MTEPLLPPEPSASGSAARRLPRVFTVLCLLAVFGHFTAIAVFLMPLSILGVHYGGSATAYVTPFFSQRWSLFAPDPPLINTFLQFQCEASGQEPTAWMDMAAVLQEKHASYRLTPESYLFRMERAAVHAGLGTKDELVEAFVDKAEEQEDEAFEQAVTELLRSRAEATARERRFLYRLVMHHCRATFGDAITRVRPRVIFQDIPKYSHRDVDPASMPATSVEFEWMTTSDIEAGRTRSEAAEENDGIDN